MAVQKAALIKAKVGMVCPPPPNNNNNRARSSVQLCGLRSAAYVRNRTVFGGPGSYIHWSTILTIEYAYR